MAVQGYRLIWHVSPYGPIHCCRCPGDAWSQVISSNGFEYVGLTAREVTNLFSVGKNFHYKHAIQQYNNISQNTVLYVYEKRNVGVL